MCWRASWTPLPSASCRFMTKRRQAGATTLIAARGADAGQHCGARGRRARGTPGDCRRLSQPAGDRHEAGRRPDRAVCDGLSAGGEQWWKTPVFAGRIQQRGQPLQHLSQRRAAARPDCRAGPEQHRAPCSIQSSTTISTSSPWPDGSGPPRLCHDLRRARSRTCGVIWAAAESKTEKCAAKNAESTETGDSLCSHYQAVCRES